MGSYVYGVVPADPEVRLEDPGIGGQPVRTVRADGLAALTSEVPDEPLEAGRDELMTHARVLETTAGRADAVLPMRFGVVMPDADAVRERLLEAFRPDLEAQLAELSGKVEMNVKGIYDEGAVLREIVAESPEIARLREAIAGAPADATYPERVRLGELVAAALDARREADEAWVVDRLAPLASAVEVNAPIHERMAVNASFLLAREQRESFEAELERVAEERHPLIGFRLTGPLPPHSFVELALDG